MKLICTWCWLQIYCLATVESRIFFYFFIKCMQFMTMILFRRCAYVKLHVSWSKSLLYIFSLINHIDSLCKQALSIKQLLSLMLFFIFIFYFFIKCMQSMIMTLFRCCMYAKLHVIWSKLLLYIFSLINHIDSLHIQAFLLKLLQLYFHFSLFLCTLCILLFHF